MLCFHRQALGAKVGQDDKMYAPIHGKQFQRDHAGEAAILVHGLVFKVSVYDALGQFCLNILLFPLL